MNSKGLYFENGESIWGFGRQNLTNEEKIGYVKDAIRRELVVNDVNGIESIDTKLFNKCTRDFVEIQNGKFVHNVNSEITSFEVNHLRNQNILLKQLIAELSHENIMLKDKLLNDSKLKISGE